MGWANEYANFFALIPTAPIVNLVICKALLNLLHRIVFPNSITVIYHDDKILTQAVGDQIQHINPSVLFHIAAQRSIHRNKVKLLSLEGLFEPLKHTDGIRIFIRHHLPLQHDDLCIFGKGEVIAEELHPLRVVFHHNVLHILEGGGVLGDHAGGLAQAQFQDALGPCLVEHPVHDI